MVTRSSLTAETWTRYQLLACAMVMWSQIRFTFVEMTSSCSCYPIVRTGKYLYLFRGACRGTLLIWLRTHYKDHWYAHGGVENISIMFANHLKFNWSCESNHKGHCHTVLLIIFLQGHHQVLYTTTMCKVSSLLVYLFRRSLAYKTLDSRDTQGDSYIYTHFPIKN